MRLAVVLMLAVAAISPAAERGSPRVNWDSASLILVGKGGAYGRMVRDGRSILCAFEHHRRIVLRRSDDEGKTWSPEADAAGYEFGNAANPELLVTKAGSILLFFNGRPRQDGKPFTIGMVSSKDHGKTWTAAATIYTAGSGAKSGCYEPAAIQQPNGEIDLFFANEFPHAPEGEQEISICKSNNDGRSWTRPVAACFRVHGRDGMPVPLRLLSGKTVISIEDNGLNDGRQLQPAVVESPSNTGWVGPSVDGGSPHRWAATDIPSGRYAGAPYLRQLPDGTTILSCQPEVKDRGQEMTVYVGDKTARHFAGGTEPFAADAGKSAQWGSIFVKNPNTVTAIGTTTIDGEFGVWAIDGTVERK
jgi:hypothetical protein